MLIATPNSIWSPVPTPRIRLTVVTSLFCGIMFRDMEAGRRQRLPFASAGLGSVIRARFEQRCQYPNRFAFSATSHSISRKPRR